MRSLAPESTGQQDLRTYLRVFWRWKLLFIAFVVLIPLGAYLVERGKPKIYQSSTLMELQDISQGIGTTGAPIVTGNLAAVARLVSTTPVVDIAAGLLHEAPGSLVSEVQASADPNTGFLTITATDHDPVRAAAVANAFAAALARHQTDQADSVIDQQIAAAARQLAATPRSNPGQRVTLSQQIAELRALKGSSGSGAVVVQAATPSATPIGPETRRAVELALVIAVLLGIGAVLLAENADRRLRTPEDVESLTGWPLLAAIPSSAFSPDHLEDPTDEEAFQMLRGALTYFNVEQRLGSVAVISPMVGDGKTTVAVGLALATARAGKRAILVDADLRRPQVCARLGLTAKAGLGAVLAGERALGDVMLDYPLNEPGAGSVTVLPAGPPPPNPAALLASESMRRIVRELEGQADLVIIDSVAALAVSDALPLLRSVSGCVVIARMNRSSRAAVRRLQKMLGSAHGTVLGIVVTGSGAAMGGYAAYHYAENGYRDGALGLLHLRRRRSRAAVDTASSNGTAIDAAGAPAGPSTTHADSGATEGEATE
jgi:capsular exopolysaccharide synthesis family protein